MSKSVQNSLQTGWALALVMGCIVAAVIGLICSGRIAFVTPGGYIIRVQTDHGMSAVRCESTTTTVIGGESYEEVKGASATYPIPTAGGYRGWIGLDQLGHQKFIPAQMWGTVNFIGHTTHNSGNWVTDVCLSNMPKLQS